jgi:hypothetical protein
MLHAALTIKERQHMATALRISDELIRMARKHSAVDHRSITGQIEHWARLGKMAEENPDLPLALIKELLIGMEELDSGQHTEYVFGTKRP